MVLRSIFLFFCSVRFVCRHEQPVTTIHIVYKITDVLWFTFDGRNVTVLNFAYYKVN